MVGRKADVAVTADVAWSVTAAREDGATLDAECIRGEGKGTRAGKFGSRSRTCAFYDLSSVWRECHHRSS